MNYYPRFERLLEQQTKSLQTCWESLSALQSLALNHPEPSVNLLTAHLEYTQDIVNSISAELEEIRKTLLPNS